MLSTEDLSACLPQVVYFLVEHNVAPGKPETLNRCHRREGASVWEGHTGFPREGGFRPESLRVRLKRSLPD